MQSVAPTRRLNRRSRDMLLAAAVVFLLGAALLVSGTSLHIVNLVLPYNRLFPAYDLARKGMLVIGAGLSLASMLMALRAVTWRTDNAAAWELGELLALQLDHHFVFIRNISRSDTGYIDAALVSHYGLLLLRITRRRGEYYNHGGSWLRRGRKRRWRALRWNPTRDIVASALRVKECCKEQGVLGLPVFAAVVFLRDAPDAQLRLQNPAVPVLHASAFAQALGDSYFAAPRLDADTVQRVVNLLYR